VEVGVKNPAKLRAALRKEGLRLPEQVVVYEVARFMKPS
jgi:hypothetical protein